MKSNVEIGYIACKLEYVSTAGETHDFTKKEKWIEIRLHIARKIDAEFRQDYNPCLHRM